MLSNVILVRVRVPWKTNQKEEGVAQQGLTGQDTEAVDVAGPELNELVAAVAHQVPTRQVAAVAHREPTKETAVAV